MRGRRFGVRVRRAGRVRGLLSRLLLPLLLLGLASAPPVRAQEPGDVRRQLAEAALRQPDEVARFYARRGHEPAWVAGGRPGALAARFVGVLREAEADGFDADAAHRPRIEPLLGRTEGSGRLSPREASRLDVALTDAFLDHAAFLLRGRVDPRTLHPGWSLPHRTADLAAELEAAVAAGSVAAVLARLAPPDSGYARLHGALDHYRRLADGGGWGTLPPGPALRLGDRGPAVRALRARLAATSDFVPASDPGAAVDTAAWFDPHLDEAVRAFQRRHGLAVDGIVGPATRAALDVPVDARVRQIVLNLERLRWLPVDLGRRHVLVDIAGYRLRVVEAGRVVLSMRVVVGTPRTPTPVFSTRLTEVVLAPYWNVPASIARNEILPLTRRDPDYLARHGMRRLADGRIRQDPGPANPLGRVKFTIPNPYGIGLHDTPERHLFTRAACAFSHGCIRLERPLDLAAYVLGPDSGWTRDRMEATIGRWRETRVPVHEPIPVHVLYRTAWVDAAGVVHFRADVYGHDARLEAALAAGTARAP